MAWAGLSEDVAALFANLGAYDSGDLFGDGFRHFKRRTGRDVHQAFKHVRQKREARRRATEELRAARPCRNPRCDAVLPAIPEGQGGKFPLYCSAACKKRAYRAEAAAARKKAA